MNSSSLRASPDLPLQTSRCKMAPKSLELGAPSVSGEMIPTYHALSDAPDSKTEDHPVRPIASEFSQFYSNKVLK